MSQITDAKTGASPGGVVMVQYQTFTNVQVDLNVKISYCL